MKGGGAIVMHSAAGKQQAPKSKTSSLFLYILLLYILLPVLVLYVAALAVSPFYSRPCPPGSGAAVSRLAAAADAKGNNAGRSSSSSTSAMLSPPTKARPNPKPSEDAAPTGLRRIVFGIGASSSLWASRREYIKVWWRPGEMRGFVWLDKPVPELYSRNASTGLPGIRISANTSGFPYTHGAGSRSALRITRIVSESFRLGLPGARWFVMGDDDTVFFPDNLAEVLSRYDHTQPYYIGNPSESHIQNLIFSYGMAFGGGGFAVSAALAAQLARMQDGCIQRYPALYGSDDRVHACMSELGVPLTRHPGFHQCDLWGDVLGLLGAHPVAPLVTLHHLDFLQPVFPTVKSRTTALRRLFAGPQSVCYDGGKEWTVSVAWGFAVVVVRGVLSPREMETPMRTFLNWYRRADYTAYAFNTRAVARQPCQRPQVHYMRQSRLDRRRNTTVTEYERHRVPAAPCRWRIPDPAALLDRVVVLKKPDPDLWKRLRCAVHSPRRNCCRVVSSPTKGKDRRMTIDVGVCREGEFARV
uniref:Fringe-related protein n=1 Tax=Setaria italica TaxID=4555 RepID=K4AMJ9_SETIT